MINEVLSEAQLSVSQLDAIGVTVGPGSFTGLRIGFATVQGLAFAADIPVVPVSTLQLMAATYGRLADVPEGTTVVPVLDARMAEFNCAVYRIESAAKVTILEPDQLLSAAQALAIIEQYPAAMVVGDAGPLIEESEFSADNYRSVYPNALDLLAIAESELAKGMAQSVETIDLVYLRGTEAWQKRKRIREL
jgi:tRNA threonylcarbamoyladenosine biosynthesis protein TsaB